MNGQLIYSLQFAGDIATIADKKIHLQRTVEAIVNHIVNHNRRSG